MKHRFFILLFFHSVASYAQEKALPRFISFAKQYIGHPKENMPGTFSNATGTIDETNQVRSFAYYYYPADASLLVFEDERFSSMMITIDSADKIETIFLFKTFSKKSTAVSDAVYTRLKETLNTILAMDAKEKERGRGVVMQYSASWPAGAITIGLTNAIFSKRKKRKFGASLDVSVSKTKGELPQQ